MAIRRILSWEKLGRGCTELRLDCGHVQRRRLSLCPPAGVLCPDCRRSALAAARIAPAVPAREDATVS